MSELIISSHYKGFGSSDAKMLEYVGRRGKLNNKANQRILEIKGLQEQKQFSTEATRYGKYIEEYCFQYFKERFCQEDIRINSNPEYHISNLGYPFEVFNHIDIEVITSDIINHIEVKAVNTDMKKTLKDYHCQLQYHWWVMNEYYNKDTRQKNLYLLYYHTKDKSSPFYNNNILLYQIEPDVITLDNIKKGLRIIAEKYHLVTIDNNAVVKSDQISEQANNIVCGIINMTKQIKETEKKLETFKQMLLESMLHHGINKIDVSGIFTLIAESTSFKLDTKKLKEENPELYQKYTKEEKRKPHIKINLKNDDK